MKEENDTNRPAQPSDLSAPPRTGRKPYQSPVLVEYGSVAKLTQGNSGSRGDGIGTAMKATCL